jgi:hypothetical protein
MDFGVARSDVVRAINQRWLLKFWKRHLGANRVPQWQSVQADSLSRIADNLSFLDIIHNGEQLRCQIRFHGALVGRVFGAADCRGRFLYDSLPDEQRAQKLGPYREAVNTGRPVYTVHDITDRTGRLVHYERLLLPFSNDGETVDRMLTSFEFICPDGAFDGNGLMQTQAAPPIQRMSVTIEPQSLD